MYEAFDDSAGADAFTYRVRDRLGKEATASIRVGIAPAPSVNQAPYAVKDAVVMRPGRAVAVPVLANDSDPEGDDLTLVSDGLDPARRRRARGRGPGRPRRRHRARRAGRDVAAVHDPRRARREATAVLQVTVDEDVPLLRPIARDDRVLAADVEDGSVDLEVLANDEDPDGTVDELTVDGRAAAGTGARATAPCASRSTTTSSCSATRSPTATGSRHPPSSTCPSLDVAPPTLISTEGIEVQSGETIELPLADHVRAPDGSRSSSPRRRRSPRCTRDGAALVKDQTTLVYTSADGLLRTGRDHLRGHRRHRTR